MALLMSIMQPNNSIQYVHAWISGQFKWDFKKNAARFSCVAPTNDKARHGSWKILGPFMIQA
jgi:hypothetical protein